MNKKVAIKNTIKSLIPKRLIFEKKKSSWLDTKVARLNRENGRNIKSEDLSVYFGSSYKNIAKYIKSVDIKSDDYYFYSIDEYKYLYNAGGFTTDNLSPNYEVFFKSIKQLRKDYAGIRDMNKIFDAIEDYIVKAKATLEEKENFKDKNSRTSVIYKYLERIITDNVNSFDEALQRILFYNGLFWQTEHRLVGFGPLDRILEKFYQDDIKFKKETDETVKEKIHNFCRIAHNYYVYKSNNLVGDTGQIIQLSGYYKKSKTFISKLDYFFIEAVYELQLPDPKILLRVTKDTPRDLYELSLKCIKTGIGCPLFANDDSIISALTSKYYSYDEAINYSTSACWEPMVFGKSADQNNQDNIVPIIPLQNLLNSGEEYETFEDFIDGYKKYLTKELDSVMERVDSRRYMVDPLLTIATAECKNKNKDITNGGAKYFNYGILTVSFANFINSMFIIKKYVYDEKKYTLSKINKKRLDEKTDDLYSDKRFGKDDREVVDLINDITSFITDYLKDKTNYYGGHYNIGFSSPSYMDQGKTAEASLDGRKKGDAFSTHISADGPLAYTELMMFAGKLDYTDNRYNGNVVDFMVSESFLENNFDKFIDFLMLSQKSGYFEMQMNVTNSKILIEAKKNPKKFPNLIVRVWGFSAYFNDLPEEYKDLLIKRALASEGK